MQSKLPKATLRPVLSTDGQDAVVHKTGITVAHSVPVRGAANKPTSAERNSDAYLCSADICSGHIHHHDKSGRGLGQSPRGGVAALPSSLDPIRSNRNRPTQKKPYCGHFTLAGKSLTSQQTQFQRLNCKSWGCSHCGPRRARRYKHAIRAIADRLKLQRFITLTLDPEKIEGDSVIYLRATFNKLRTYLRRKYGSAPKYIAVLEFHENGKPHLHILIDRFIEQAWLSTAWDAVGGGRIVDIRFVDLHRVSHYLAKYLTVDLLLSAPKGVRRVTCSRGIVLLEQSEKTHTWILLKTPISYLYSRLFLLAVQLQFDEDKILTGFIVVNPTLKEHTQNDH